jgi:hypothetical protein
MNREEIGRSSGVGAGVKQENEKGYVRSQSLAATASKKSNLFKAVGDNTIPVSKYVLPCYHPSKLIIDFASPIKRFAFDCNNWRIINSCSFCLFLCLLADTLLARVLDSNDRYALCYSRIGECRGLLLSSGLHPQQVH